MEKETKQQRVDKVNSIIREIANRGRKFFAHQDRIATVSLRNGRVYYKSEYHGVDMCLSIPDYRKPKRWHHGGTLMGLCRDFRDYIQTGEKTNHRHGYGGLYCPHWGYSDSDMKEIQAFAKSIGYL